MKRSDSRNLAEKVSWSDGWACDNLLILDIIGVKESYFSIRLSCYIQRPIRAN